MSSSRKFKESQSRLEFDSTDNIYENENESGSKISSPSDDSNENYNENGNGTGHGNGNEIKGVIKNKMDYTNSNSNYEIGTQDDINCLLAGCVGSGTGSNMSGTGTGGEKIESKVRTKRSTYDATCIRTEAPSLIFTSDLIIFYTDPVSFFDHFFFIINLYFLIF